MSKEIDVQKKVIVMRKGAEIWVTLEQAEKLEQLLSNLQGHRFVKINGQMLNTADMEGVYTAEEVASKHRLAAGETKCFYGNWHGKRERCDCAKEISKRREADRVTALIAENARELTPTEREHQVGKMQSVREHLEARGLLQKREEKKETAV